MNTSVPVVGALLISVFAPSPSRADTWVVRADGSGDAATIQAAVDSAIALDTIELNDGIFSGPGNRDVVVSKTLVFRSSSNDPTQCVIDCQGSDSEEHRAFRIDRRCEFQGLTITNGYVLGEGGAIFCAGGEGIQVSNCIFRENTSSSSGGSMGFEDADLARRQSSSVLPSIQVHQCVFDANHAGSSGGAAQFIGYEAHFTECRFLQNTAQGGGAISFLNSQSEFIGCLFVNNEASFGGGVDCGDPALFRTCTFAANRALQGSGAHFYIGGFDNVVTVDHSILAFAKEGGSIHCEVAEPFQVEISCSDIFGNQGGDWIDCLASHEGTDGNISADPLFCDVGAGDHTLDVNSPCAPENAEGCDRIGAYDVNCDLTSVEEQSWSQIKAKYR